MGLIVDSVRKKIKEKQILNDVFLSCIPGEIVGLLGRNGAGKSSLLRIIFGSLNADNKFVSLDGKQINSLGDHKGKLSYLPQHNFLPTHVKVEKLIRCFSDLSNATLFGNELIKPMLNRKVGELSGGERRLLEVLLIIHSDAKYLLLDEPFNGLSPIHVGFVKDILKKNARNNGILISDHRYQHVLDISTKVMLLKEGNIKHIKDLKLLISLGYLPAI